MKNHRVFQFLFVLALIVGIVGTVAIVYASQQLSNQGDSVYRICVDQHGNLRLLHPDIRGKSSDKCKKNEFMIELPPSRLIAMLETKLNELSDNVSEQESRISNLEDTISGLSANASEQENTISQLVTAINEQEGRINNLEDIISELEDTVSDLESRVAKLEGISDNAVAEGYVLWLPLDEGQGSVAKDKSGFGNDGTIFGAQWVNLNGGYALSFDGTDDKVDCGSGTSLSITQAITIETWIKANAPGTHHGTLYAKVDRGSNNGIRVTILNNDYLIIQNNVTGSGRAAAFAYSPYYGNWHHVVGTYDRQNLQLFLDGEPKSAQADTKAIPSVANNAWIGRQYHPTASKHPFDGLIGEVRIYNRALTPQEIQYNYITTKWKYQ